MSEIAGLLFWPGLACLVLTGIHVYLGLHVVERGVIFVDLSLAQVAALGATVALLLGFDMHGQWAYVFSLGFTFIGAVFFALSRSRKAKFPQEAIIGIVYAVSAAAAILIMDRSPEGAEHIKYMLAGNLLAVSPGEVAKMALLYSLVGVLHWFWRKPFFAITLAPREAVERGYSIRLWDFLFYITFGIVVTSSVAIAGVLLVFSYLIVPAVSATLFAERISSRLALGWTMGALVSIVGLCGSYFLDTPTGATIICVFGLTLLFLVAFLGLRKK